MENKTNKLIAAQYQLFTISDNGERTLVEETTKEQPFVFITGFDAALDALEERLENLKLGEKFDFELEKEQAFGEYEPKRVIDLNKEMFTVDGSTSTIRSLVRSSTSRATSSRTARLQWTR